MRKTRARATLIADRAILPESTDSVDVPSDSLEIPGDLSDTTPAVDHDWLFLEVSAVSVIGVAWGTINP